MSICDLRASDKAYFPTPAQALFHRSNAKVKAMLGGMRSGKTMAGVNEVLDHGLENPGSFCWIVSPTQEYWGPPRDHLQYSIDIVTRRNVSPIVEDQTAKPPRWVLRNGSVIEMKSAFEPDSLHGRGLSIFDGDECGLWDSEESWSNLMGRIAVDPARPGRMGRCCVTYTPPKNFNWSYDEFWRGPRDRTERIQALALKERLDEMEREELALLRADDADMDIFNVSMRDNPYVSPKAIEYYRRKYSPKKFEQLVEGRYVVLEGAVYDNFDHDAHVIPSFSIPNQWRIVCGMDYGLTVSAWVSLQIAISPDEPTMIGDRLISPRTMFVTDEIYEYNMSLDKKVRVLQRQAGKQLAGRPDGWQPQRWMDRESPDILDLRSRDVHVMATPIDRSRFSKSTEIDYGVEAVWQLIQDGRLYVFRNCQHTVEEFHTYTWDSSTGRPIKKNDHAMDALRYAVQSAYMHRPLPEAEIAAVELDPISRMAWADLRPFARGDNTRRRLQSAFME